LTKNRTPQFFYGYTIVLSAFFIMVVMWGTASSFGVFFKPLLAEFGWTRAMVSGAVSLSIIVSGLAAIVLGRLTDKFGPRLVVTAGGCFLGLGYLLMSQISATWQLYLFRGVIIGIGLGAGWVPLVSPVARWFAKKRGMMTGVVVAGAGVGVMIMPPAASWLISNYGWRLAYTIIGIVALASVIPAAQFLKRDPDQMGLVPHGVDEAKIDSPNLETGGFSLQEVIRTRQFWVLSAMWLFFGFSLEIILVHVVPYATDLGISAISAANILAISGGVSILGGVIMGNIADRSGNRSALIITSIFFVGALIWLVVAKELRMLYLLAAIFGFGYGGLFTLESPIVAKLFGLSSHGAVMGYAGVGFMIGGALGPVFAGRMFDITGSYQTAFLVSAAASVIALILALLLRLGGKEVTDESKRGAQFD
jgi:MFS family permease